jgi:hypothetical protein
VYQVQEATSRSTATSTGSTSIMPQGNNNRNSQRNSDDRTTNPPIGQATPPAQAPRVSDHGGQDSIGRTHQIDADHDMLALRLQEAEKQLAQEREERCRVQKTAAR